MTKDYKALTKDISEYVGGLKQAAPDAKIKIELKSDYSTPTRLPFTQKCVAIAAV